MNRSDLESKHLSELHTLAAEAGVERYRMLTRDELIEKLAGGGAPGGGSERGSREPRSRRESGGSRGGSGGSRGGSRGGRGESRGGRGGARSGGGESRGGRPDSQERREPRGEEAPAPSAGSGEEPQPRRRRRRRRFGRRGRKTVRVTDVLLPASPGRQAVVYADSRAGCTALLRELAAELSGGRGPDPVALLVDPTPEELADWKREAPKAEIVSAGQERHAEDALAQAASRAGAGEGVIVLIDSLTRAAEEFGGSKVAKELFDAAGQATVVAAIERSD